MKENEKWLANTGFFQKKYQKLLFLGFFVGAFSFFASLALFERTVFSEWILFFLMGGVLLVAWYFPWLVFLLFLGSASLEIVSIFSQEMAVSFRPYQFLGIVAFLGLSISFVKQRRVRMPKIYMIDIGVICIAIGGFLSSFFSHYPEESFRLSIIMLSFVFLYGVIRLFLVSRKQILEIIPYMIVSFILTTWFGIWQNIAYLLGWNHFEIMPGRPNAFFSEPDWLGLFSALLLISIWFFFLSWEKTKNVRYTHSVLLALWIASVFGSVILILSVSRSAWLAFFLGIFVLFVWALWVYRFSFLARFSLILLSLPVALLYVKGIPLTNFELGNRLQSSVSGLQEITISCEEKRELPVKVPSMFFLQQNGCRHIDLEEIEYEQQAGYYITRVFRDDPNAQERKGVWVTAKESLLQRPLVGVGWGGIAPLLGQDARGEDLNTSNIFLGMWLGGGIISFIGMLTIVFWLVFESFRLIQKPLSPGFRSGGWILSTLAVFGVFNLFNSSELLAVSWVWLGIVVSLIGISKSQSDEKNVKKKHGRNFLKKSV